MVLRPSWLVSLVLANLAASALHFADNVARFGQYPEPPWLNAPLVAFLWFLQSAVGVAGLLLTRRARPAGRPILWVYAALGFTALGHYAVPATHPMDAAMHALIALEALAALALLLGLAIRPGTGTGVAPAQ